MPKVTISSRSDESQIHQLDELASASKRDRTQLITEALENYLELQKWQMTEIRAALVEAKARDFASDAEVEAVFDLRRS